MEQLLTDFVLKRAEACGNGGLGYAEALRRPAQRSSVEHRQECFDIGSGLPPDCPLLPVLGETSLE